MGFVKLGHLLRRGLGEIGELAREVGLSLRMALGPECLTEGDGGACGGLFHRLLQLAGEPCFLLGDFLRAERRRAQLLGEQGDHGGSVGAQAAGGEVHAQAVGIETDGGAHSGQRFGQGELVVFHGALVEERGREEGQRGVVGWAEGVAGGEAADDCHHLFDTGGTDHEVDTAELPAKNRAGRGRGDGGGRSRIRCGGAAVLYAVA